MIYSIFQNSNIVNGISRANNYLMYNQKDFEVESILKRNDGKKKRSREVFEIDNELSVYDHVVKKMHEKELVNIFNILIMEEFYVQVSNHPGHKCYEEICNILLSFRNIIKNAEAISLRKDMGDRDDFLRTYLEKELLCLLEYGKQIIFLFNMSTS